MNSFAQTSTDTSQERVNQPLRILIVDDEPRMRSSLQLLLEGAGLEIFTCGTGRSAIETLKTREIDLVLLDVSLPDISGLEVLEWINAATIPTIAIMVSANDSLESAISALRNGAADFVHKPVEWEELRHKVESALHRRRMEQNHQLMSARLEHSERLHRFLVESSPDLVYTLDPEGRFMFINGRVESLLGYSREELIGCKYTEIVHEDDQERAVYAFRERRSGKRATTNAELRLKRNNKHSFQFANRYIVAMLNATGIYENNQDGSNPEGRRFLGTYGVARDITERKLAEETISFQAFHDLLTQLPNRRLFKDRLELALLQAKRHGAVVAVMFIDLDRFKLVNDTHGHAEGDELLKSVAHRLRRCVRSSDTISRQGGDEFTVLLPDLAHADDAILIADKILEEFKQPFQVAGQGFRVTASIGISVFPHDGENADVLLKHADIAMYKVKNDGKNGFKFFTGEMNSSHYERFILENELRQAIQKSEFELHYQPLISINRGKIIGMEALIRWRHPRHGLLSPSNFIDMAEETGLIYGITDWVLAEACSQLARWHSMGHNELHISVNVSPQEFNRNDVVKRISSNLVRYGLPANSLQVEITENLLLQDVSAVIEKMLLLRDHGISFSIDDFGTGFSSLNYLRRIPIDTIKIDQSFVLDLAEHREISPIIPAIIGIARGFGLHVVAEGIETDYQMNILQDLGCDEMQGFLFSRPLPAAEVECLLSASQTIPRASLPAGIHPAKKATGKEGSMFQLGLQRTPSIENRVSLARQ